MAAKIGILGESSATGAATVTLYTVPSDKAARVRVLFAVQGGAGNWQYSVMIGTPNDEINIHTKQSSGDDMYSGAYEEATPDPAGQTLASVQGIRIANNKLQLTGGEGQTGYGWWITPLPVDYYLSTGDTVKFNINTTAGLDALIQVIGVEDDA